MCLLFLLICWIFNYDFHLNDQLPVIFIYKIILITLQINATTNDKLETLEGELKTVKVLLQEKEGVSYMYTGTIQPVIQISPVKEDCLVFM